MAWNGLEKRWILVSLFALDVLVSYWYVVEERVGSVGKRRSS